MSRGSKKYYITVIDDYLRYTRLCLLSHKDEAEVIFIKHKIKVETQIEKKIKKLRYE